ncbi:MAG: hypothetical protein M1837_002339 [Sclerophora amabilis]|nr:MAG: hypothetical protein M1837_002339 [Sclerophora amabilis]
MPSQLLHPNEYELVARSSSDSGDEFDLDDADPNSERHPLTRSSSSFYGQPWFWLPKRLASFLPSPKRRTKSSPRRRPKPFATRTCIRRRGVRHLCLLCAGCVGVVSILVILTSIFNPSYTTEPTHYQHLRRQAHDTGRANPNNEKVLIAANIIDEDLIRGAWGNAILELIQLLGEGNVFLSIYENDSGPGTKAALDDFEEKLRCNSSIVSEHLPLDDIDTIVLPSGKRRIKRVAYLAEVRNRALRPLDPLVKPSLSGVKSTESTFDKLLFLNDIVFSPLEAAQLLFSTNVGEDGLTQYRAACAVDFINPFKFYDTFATRDLEGFSMGVPFFPWFSRAGSSQSRQDVLEGKDAVRVRSCWGGMVAFEAKWFQHPITEDVTDDTKPEDSSPDQDRNLNWHLNDTAIRPRADVLPVRFRSEKDTFWDASECCLIHADIQPIRKPSDSLSDTGIYVNPFIRVAYDEKTFSWLRTTRMWERLYSVPHHLVNKIAGLPFYNPRRTEIPGEKVTENVWVYHDTAWQNDKDGSTGGKATAKPAKKKEGSYQSVQRMAGRGGFCGTRKLLVLKENPKEGEKKWESLPVPPV